MSTNEQELVDWSPVDQEFNLLCGSGGSKAILGGAGALMAIHLAGVEAKTVGGVSGGSIVTALYAAGVRPPQLVRTVIDIDFTSLISRHAGFWRILFAYLFRERNNYLMFRPKKGLFSSEKLGEFIDTHVPEWPESFWTAAVSGSSLLIFNRGGVHEYTHDGHYRLITATPPPVGLAVRASSAIPGIFNAVEFQDQYLHDGAMSAHGRSPVGIVKRHFKSRPEDILVVDIRDDDSEALWLVRKFWSWFWRLTCGKHCSPEGAVPHDSDGSVLIQLDIKSVRSLEFRLKPDQKWQALMTGFGCAVKVLEKRGLMSGARLTEAKCILKAYGIIRGSSRVPGELALQMEALLARHGLY